MTINNRLIDLFKRKRNDILSIFVTAGFPTLDSLPQILIALQDNGVDLVEIGIPFSDPIADGPTIQHSSAVALRNGMTLKLLFEQLATVKDKITMPLLLMGYFNPILKYNVESFCLACSEANVAGAIIPDLPLAEYQHEYQNTFKKYNLSNILLFTPETTYERIDLVDKYSTGFLYAVSTHATTGGQLQIDRQHTRYFERISKLKLNNPVLIGFGISSRDSFKIACKFANGAIIGSAFVRTLADISNYTDAIRDFISKLR